MATGFRADLARRVATSVVAVPLLLIVVFLGHPLACVALVGAMVLAGLYEFFALLQARGIAPMRTVGVLLTGAIFAEVALPDVWRPGMWAATPLVLLAAAVFRGGEPAERVTSASGTLLGATYLGALGGSLAGLRMLHPLGQGSGRLFLLLAIVMLSDVFAYFVGHVVGGRRLAPRISPGKSVGGAVGGLVGGVAGAALVRSIGLIPLSAAEVVGLGLSVAAIGMLGDLAESLLKRWAGVKDSGRLFPGHGGALDRLDSLLFGAPVLYYYFSYVR